MQIDKKKHIYIVSQNNYDYFYIFNLKWLKIVIFYNNLGYL